MWWDAGVIFFTYFKIIYTPIIVSLIEKYEANLKGDWHHPIRKNNILVPSIEGACDVGHSD